MDNRQYVSRRQSTTTSCSCCCCRDTDAITNSSRIFFPMQLLILYSLSLICTRYVVTVNAFIMIAPKQSQHQHHQQHPYTIRELQQQPSITTPITASLSSALLLSSSYSSYSPSTNCGGGGGAGGGISLDPNSIRDINGLQEWAIQYGVIPENGFCLVEDSETNQNYKTSEQQQYYATTTSAGGQAGDIMLQVPQSIILSSKQIQLEYQPYINPQSLYILQQYVQQQQQQQQSSTNTNAIISQFYVFLRLLVEYQLDTQSPYYMYLNGMPKQYNTGSAMDDFCFSCLPPYLFKLCTYERTTLQIYQEAIQTLDFIPFQIKHDTRILKFIYNIVRTRSWPSASINSNIYYNHDDKNASPHHQDIDDDDDDVDYHIVPIADMLNHGYPSNCAIVYDDEGNCQIQLIEQVQPGEPLTIEYGPSTNPAQLLATYGFLYNIGTTYSKLHIPNPSMEMFELGYDPNQLLVSTIDGSIAPQVWDIVLYTRLERKKEFEQDRKRFIDAHRNNDETTKAEIHNKHYHNYTYKAMIRHVQMILAEIADLRVKTNVYDYSNHPRLPLIQRHNDLVWKTFEKVQTQLLSSSSSL